jgi:hypothetical protein
MHDICAYKRIAPKALHLAAKAFELAEIQVVRDPEGIPRILPAPPE